MMSCIPNNEPASSSFLSDLPEAQHIAAHDAVTKPTVDQVETFGRKLTVKSSSYGTSAPFKPSWAKKAAAATKPRKSTARLVPDTEPYHGEDWYEPDEWATADATFWGPGSDPKTPASKGVLPCGSIAALRYSHTGDTLAVASNDGCLYSVPLSALTDSPEAAPCGHVVVKAKAGQVVSHETGTGASLRTKPPMTCAALSYYEYRGLSARLRQTDTTGNRGAGAAASTAAKHGLAAAASSIAAKRTATKSKFGVDSNVPCRVLLGCGGGEDRSAWLWAAGSGRTAPLLRIDNEALSAGSSGPSSSAAGSSSRATPTAAGPSPVLPSSVSSCCFYYLDRYILLASGSRITAVGYSLGSDTSVEGQRPMPPLNNKAGANTRPGEDELSRLKRKCLGDTRAWVASSWTAVGDGDGASATTVTHVAAHNTFRSPLVFAACSDRTVRVYDVASGSTAGEALRVPGAHARAVHTLALPEHSSYADVPASSVDCFLTASTEALPGGAAGGGPGSNGLIRLWDLRSAKCARQFAGAHSNSKHVTGVAISPDFLYVATGSEDRCAVIYDSRMERAVSKLRGAGDTVTSVAWHPRTQHLIAGSLDGAVRAYSCRAAKGVGGSASAGDETGAAGGHGIDGVGDNGDGIDGQDDWGEAGPDDGDDGDEGGY